MSWRTIFSLRIFVMPALLWVLSANQAVAQQFNSDNWWVLPHGVGMGILNIGENYSSMYLGYGFAEKWEADVAATLYPEDQADLAHYSTTVYLKRLLYENAAKTGGAAVMAGIGQSPAYYQAGTKIEDFKNYWAVIPFTFPFRDNGISWDVLPGFVYNNEYGPEKKTAWGFTYSSRVAIYRIIPKSAIVGEVFGATGDAKAEAQYRAGVRWEGNKYVTVAVTYGDGLEGNKGAGFEVGVMVLTPSFF